MRIVCWQTILIKYNTVFLRKLGKLSQTLSSAAVVIGASRVNNISAANSNDVYQGAYCTHTQYWSREDESTQILLKLYEPAHAIWVVPLKERPTHTRVPILVGPLGSFDLNIGCININLTY